jgi:phosphate transport system substrate-binding protein
MNKNRMICKKIGLLIFFFLPIQASIAEPPLRIVGSSAVFPFAATVAEHFHLKTNEPTPLIEATGTGGGIKLFCSSDQGSDGVMTSRPFTEGEKKKCESNGITYVELKIGQDGLVLIQNRNETSFPLTLKDLSFALSETIAQNGQCVPNPSKMWSDVNKILPNLSIHVFGPAPTSGTYDVLMEKIGDVCGSSLRHDGVYVEAPANENLIVQKILNSKQTIGIVTFSFFDQNKSRLNGFPIHGIFPSGESIQNGTYPLSRPLYLYVKTNHITYHPVRISYALEFMSPEAIGETGYLREKGLIPLRLEEEKEMHQRAKYWKKDYE